MAVQGEFRSGSCQCACVNQEDVNNLGGSVGLLVQSPADAGADQIPTGDLDTAVKYGERVATITVRLK